MSRLKRKRLSQLLDDPRTRQMSGDVEVQNAPTIMADDKEAVEHPKRDRRNGKEIHGRDGFPVITKKGKPALATSWSSDAEDEGGFLADLVKMAARLRI